MKEINPTQENTGCETSNGNTIETETACLKTEDKLEDINKNEMSKELEVLDDKNGSNATNDVPKEVSQENGNVETVISKVDEKPQETKPKELVPKYKYGEDQWSPMNTTGKKCYDLNFLKQVKDDPRTKDKPDIPKLEECRIIRTTPIHEPFSLNLANIRPTHSDALFPNFAKTQGSASKNISRDGKRDGRNMSMGKSSAKMMSSPSTGSPMKPNVIRVSLSLREDVKLNESENAWKPTRFTKENLQDEDKKTEEVSKKFRSILNKLTPQKFDTLIQRVKELEINTQKRLQEVIDLVFEKAIEEPNFSEVYAALCNKLSGHVVPSDSNPEQSITFRVLIINKCQSQFMTKPVVEELAKLEKECAECTDPAKKKELQLYVNEENRKIRMRSVGNVRFIGELYKLKMLTLRIMLTCINLLLENVEEEKLECLCKLLTTIGHLVETEVKDGKLDVVFKNLQRIVDQRTNKISSRVRFMLQDLIELRRRQWVKKGVVDTQPKMMDQIQKEAEQQHRQTELLNSMGGPGGYRKDDSRGKRGDSRRQNQPPYIDQWKVTKTKQMPIDASKIKVVAGDKNIDYNNIKLRPGGNIMWGHGSGAKSASASPIVNMPATANKFSLLDDSGDSPVHKGPESTPNFYSKGASIERSTFNTRGESAPSSKSGSMGVPHMEEPRKLPELRPTPVQPLEATQVPLTKPQSNLVESLVEESLSNADPASLCLELRERFKPESHGGVVTAVFNLALAKSAKEVPQIAASLLELVSTNVISAKNLLAGLVEIFEFAPDYFIDIPLLYVHLSTLLVPHIEKKYITFEAILKLSQGIISANQGHLLLKSLLQGLKTSMGPTFVKSKWQESQLKLSEWMPEDQVAKFVTDNKLEYLEGDVQPSEETKKQCTPAEAQSKLLQLMNAEESCDCIRGWVKDNVDTSTNEDWFMRALIKALCQYALFGPDSKGAPHFNQDRMNKYSELIQEFGNSKTATEASCLFGVQQLVHQLEHPQGLTLEIFQYLHEQYIISLEGFTEWEESDLEPEGKAVMLKALTSFFTSIKEVDNDDSLSED